MNLRREIHRDKNGENQEDTLSKDVCQNIDVFLPQFSVSLFFLNFFFSYLHWTYTNMHNIHHLTVKIKCTIFIICNKFAYHNH